MGDAVDRGVVTKKLTGATFGLDDRRAFSTIILKLPSDKNNNQLNNKTNWSTEKLVFRHEA
jgi:hypothetical protein